MTPAGPDKVLRVEVPRGALHMAWLDFIRPLIGLRDREADIVAYLLSHGIRAVTQGDRGDMCSGLRLTRPHLRKILVSLRRKGFLNGDRVNRRFVPEGRGDGHFRLMIDFVEHD